MFGNFHEVSYIHVHKPTFGEHMDPSSFVQQLYAKIHPSLVDTIT